MARDFDEDSDIVDEQKRPTGSVKKGAQLCSLPLEPRLSIG
jgi:hypothetical protein